MKSAILEPDARSRISLKKLDIDLADGYIPTVSKDGVIVLSPVEVSIKTLTEKLLDANPDYVAEMDGLAARVAASPDDYVF